jgi:hypothetical protein
MTRIMISTGVSFEPTMLRKIDADRGSLPRSLFLRLIVEQHYNQTDDKKNKPKKRAEPAGRSFQAASGSSSDGGTLPAAPKSGTQTTSLGMEVLES